MQVKMLIYSGLLCFAFGTTAMLGCSSQTNQEQSASYHCPMHPQVISDRAGSCNICGMDLVPIEKSDPEEKIEQSQESHSNHDHGTHEPAGYKTINLNTEKQQLIGVKTKQVKKESLIYHSRVAGEVAHDPDMYQAQVEYLKALSYGSSLRDSAKIKLEHLGMSGYQIRALEKRGQAKRNLIVTDRDPIYWIYVYLYEKDLPHFKINQRVIISVPSMNNDVFVGKLKALRAHIDTKTRSVRGIVEVKDSSHQLRPGLFVNADLSVNLKSLLVMPFASVIDTGERQVVFVKKGQATFEPRQVKLGSVAGDWVQVLAGVHEGENVVVGANFMLDSESKLQAVIDQSGATQEHQH